ncbi:YncE family protein [Acidobacterium sp. S8]|uniref:YncE family protein n=1 Tax=Acidobacterium sp. S8 TaxID=1641854 RepID=UPI00131E86B5|nr:YncE family protein [Acidobacterium sp. S8]
MSGFWFKGKLSLLVSAFYLLSSAAGAAHAQKVVATIPVLFASDVTVNPLTGLGYVPAGNGVDIIDEKKNASVGFIAIDSSYGAEEAAINPFTNRLYVSTSQALYVVNTVTNKVIARVNVPAVGVAVNVVTDKIYVSDFNSSVYVVDGHNNDIHKQISLSGGVENLAVNPVTNRVYVAEETFPGTVEVIDGKNDKVMASITDGGALTFNVGIDTIHDIIYTADQLGTVSVINGATDKLTATIQVGGQPADVSVDPLHQRVYVANSGLNAVQVINGVKNTLIDSIPVGNGPDYSDIDILRELLYVVNSQDGTVTAINTK